MSCTIWMLKAGTQKNRHPGIPGKHIMNQAVMELITGTSTPACCLLHRACGHVVAHDLCAGDPHSVYLGEKAPGTSDNRETWPRGENDYRKRGL